MAVVAVAMAAAAAAGGGGGGDSPLKGIQKKHDGHRFFQLAVTKIVPNL